MDYSWTRRFGIAFSLTALLIGAAGCPENQPGGGGKLQTAEELYRAGRAAEDRVAGSEAEAQTNLQQARTDYIQALGASPSPKLEAYIRAGLANVAFYQDDYATAVQQGMAAYNGLEDGQLKSMDLLRMGMAQQRLGHFSEADRLYQQLMQHYPTTDAAKAARGKYGLHQFYVQLAVFSQSNLADKAIAQLRKDGLSPAQQIDGQGRRVISVGPLGTYAEAQAVKARLAGQYPTAYINP